MLEKLIYIIEVFFCIFIAVSVNLYVRDGYVICWLALIICWINMPSPEKVIRYFNDKYRKEK